MEMTLGKLAIHLDGMLLGGQEDTPVQGVSGYDTVAEGEVTFAMNERSLAEAERTPALAIIVPEQVTSSAKPVIAVHDPRAAFGLALRFFDWRRPVLPGIDPTASIAHSAAIHGRAHIGAFTAIGECTVIGDGCVISAHTVIGDQVEIGAGTIIYPNVTIYPHCSIGKNVIIHSGAIIGADGHGYQPGLQGWEKIPHVGTVIIEDDVEIGANTTIDRATTGKTFIGKGTKIDNLVQIAHNVQVGSNCMILGQVGISGSCIIEDGVIIAGQAGLRDHIRIGAGARLAVRAGVTKDIASGLTVSGYPAQPHAEELRLEAMRRKIPDLLATVRKLQRQVDALETRLSNDTAAQDK